MSSNPARFLCGGIFFALLVQAKAKYPPIESGLMYRLIRIVKPDIDDTLISLQPYNASQVKSRVSHYKSCQIECGEYIPFNQESFSMLFTEEVKKGQDGQLLERMEDFITECIQREKIQWLGSALMEIIEDDTSIDGECCICFDNDFSLITKTELLSKENGVRLSNLLLGVYYYIIRYRGNQNRDGRATYRTMFEPITGMPRSRRRAVGNTGKKYQDRIEAPPKEKGECQTDFQQTIIENQTVDKQNVSHQTVNHQQVTNQYNIMGGTFQLQNGNNNRSYPGNITNLTINNE